MVTSSINHNGKDYKFLASSHGDRELVAACRALLAEGWRKTTLIEGGYAGSPVVAEANRVNDESGHLPVVFVK